MRNNGYTQGRARDPERGGFDDSYTSNPPPKQRSSSKNNFCLWGGIICCISTVVIVAIVLVIVFWDGFSWERDYEVHNHNRGQDNIYSNPGQVAVVGQPAYNQYPWYQNYYSQYNGLSPYAQYPNYPSNGFSSYDLERQWLLQQGYLNQGALGYNQGVIGGGMYPGPVIQTGQISSNSGKNRDMDYVVREREGFIRGD